MQENTYNGIYLGIVIQNNDPEHQGRVKVYIPHISTTILNLNKSTEDILFNFIDNENNPNISNILNELKAKLPWAYQASPIFSGCASGRYNAYLRKGFTSDSNQFENQDIVEGFRPLHLYVNENVMPDAFSETGKNNNKFVNPYAYLYKPSNYSNMARGLFSIPNVGAHVWVFFVNGDINFPVYFASFFSSKDFKKIYSMSQKDVKEFSSTDYPGKFENYDKTQTDFDIDVETFRNKVVFNTNKNTIELIDTDERETIKFTHYSGSFKEFNNFANIEFAVKNDQKMVLGDSFKTIKNNNSVYIGKNEDYIINCDRFLKIGNQNFEAVKEILKINKKIHEYKRLFDIQRTWYNDKSIIYAPNAVSIFQKQKGIYASCPSCGGKPYIQKKWDMAPIMIRLCLPTGLPGKDIPIPGIQPISNFIGQVGYKGGMRCDVCNKLPSQYKYVEGHLPGQSPSTENGFWAPEDLKLADGDMDKLLHEYEPKFLELEEKLGEGGDDIQSISRNKIVTVGLAVNNLKTYRIDARGKMRINKVFVSLEETYESSIPVPHVEHVDATPIPGGDYIITAGNKYKLLVGANGINIKTFGPIEMYGTILNITGEQTNIITTNDLFLDGGENLTLRARNISIIPFEHNPLLIEGQLHITRNLIVKGGAYIEGELGIQHITAPREWQKTQPAGCIFIKAPVINGFAYVSIPDHVHLFANLPLKLTSCREETRDSMIQMGINGKSALQSMKPKHAVESLSLDSFAEELSSSPSSVVNIINNIVGGIPNTSKLENLIPKIGESIGDELNNVYKDLERMAKENLSQIFDSTKEIDIHIQ